jgi:maleate cis-trans isomerase
MQGRFSYTPQSKKEAVMAIVSPWYYLGYIIPHLYTDMDAYQFYRVAPEGMVLVTTQLNLHDRTLPAVEDELPTLWERFALLGKLGRLNRIAVSGVPLASALGRARTLALLEEASSRTGLPCDTDIEAHIRALKHLGATRIALAAKWSDSFNQKVIRYLGEAGIEVVASRGWGSTLEETKSSNAAADHLRALEAGRQLLAGAPTAQALMMVGGLWFAIHAVPILETEFGKPVTLNITATTWAALHTAGDRLQQRPDPRWGKLLASL